MRIVKVKANKHADVIITGTPHGGPSTIHVVTRTRLTGHGELFRDLLMKVAPDAASRGGVPPKQIVKFCEDVAMEAAAVMNRNKALAITIPSYDTLLHKLRGSDASQPDDSAEVVSLFTPQEREP